MVVSNNVTFKSAYGLRLRGSFVGNVKGQKIQGETLNVLVWDKKKMSRKENEPLSKKNVHLNQLYII